MNVKVMRAQGDKCQHPSICASGAPAIHNWQGQDLCSYHSPFDSDRETFPYQDGERVTLEGLLATGNAFERNMFGHLDDDDYAVVLDVESHGDAGSDKWAYTEIKLTLMNHYQNPSRRLFDVVVWTIESFLQGFNPMGTETGK